MMLVATFEFPVGDTVRVGSHSMFIEPSPGSIHKISGHAVRQEFGRMQKFYILEGMTELVPERLIQSLS